MRRGTEGRFPVRCRLLAGLLLGAAFAIANPAILDAQTVLSLGTASVLPDSAGVPIPLTMSNDVNVNAIDVAGEYDNSKITLTEVTLDDGLLANVDIELFSADIEVAQGEFTIQIVLDSAAPFQTIVGTGIEQVVATLLFDVDNFLFPGTAAPIEFADGSGNPALDNQVLSSGLPQTLVLNDGMISITDEHVLTVADAAVPVGTVGHLHAIKAFNSEDVQGFSIVITYDTDVLEGVDFTTEDTITGATGAEYEHATINNDEGYGIFAVLLDALPPFAAQVIPSSGTELVVAYFVCNVLEDLEGVTSTEIVPTDGLGTPPISNIFVINAESVTPITLGGTLTILGAGIFVRADANQDGNLDISDPIFSLSFVFGMQAEPTCLSALDSDDNGTLDLADAIYTLNYVFLHGPVIPAPFPEPGLDPTPDLLPCAN
ncbi:MAG: hypothetical protein L0Z55_11850 [Planctomycetes bacterium]|nr:hypothetical protein [Planctomycetota bacterium]